MLVVDDSQLTRKMLTRLLQGAEVGQVGMGGAEGASEGEGGRGVGECLEAVDGLAAVDLVRRRRGAAGVGVGMEMGNGGLTEGEGEGCDDKPRMVGGGVWGSGVGQVAGASEGCSDSGSGIDVVIMDGNMPRMSGPAAAREMRALGYRGIILGLSGETRDKLAAFTAPVHFIMLYTDPREFFCSNVLLSSIFSALFVSQATSLPRRTSRRRAPTAVCSSQWAGTPCWPHSPHT